MNNNGYILIVEDSKTQAGQLEAILKPLGYPISIAYNAKDALSYLKQKRPALVIADILMPEMNGYQLCSLIKSDEKYSDIPVMLLTQLSDPKEVIKGLESGADDFISKPYNEELLLTRIKMILSIRAKEEVVKKKINILVVEDSPTQAEQLKYLLEEHGYDVSTAGNGKDGLESARKSKPDLVVADILMPVMDGYTMAYEIKRDEALKKIPIILITSLMEKKDIVRKASVVADGFFTKPYDDEYLLTKIKSLISSKYDENKDWDKNGIDVRFAGEQFAVKSNRRQILTFLLSTYENAVQQNHDLIMMQRELQLVNEHLEEKVRERTEELEASEKSFRSLADDANDAIAIASAKGDYVYANKKFANLTDYSVEELLKMNIRDVIEPELLQETIDRFKTRISGKIPKGYIEMNIVGKGGRRILVEITSSRTIWHGEPALIGIMRDISERKKREEDLIRASKLESLGVLAGGIAHDFNNIMTGVMANISLALKLCDSEDKIYKLLNNAENAAVNARGLANQLLTFAKGGAPVKKTISIVKLLKEDVEFACRGSNIKCIFKISDDLWAVDVDEGQLNQVVYNMIINAEQAMPKGGVVEVSAENKTISPESGLPLKGGEYVVITIRDSGIGISEENLKKIFDPYFTTKEKGSGLGLATSYSIIKKHDGHISVESKIGIGTTFFIYLPKSEKELPLEEEAGVGELIYGKGNVLIMDDEEILRTAAGLLLGELGYSVDFARDGREAIEVYKKAKDSGEPFNVVIMDLTIPGGMGGKEAIKELLEIDPDVRAIVCSGYSTDPIMSEFKDYGFKAVIVKPYDIDVLSRTVNDVIKGEGK
jgi:PAS domain S-box-containing protein